MLQIKEDLKALGIKEDPEACWTTPFAEMILDWIRKVFRIGDLMKLSGSRLQIR